MSKIKLSPECAAELDKALASHKTTLDGYTQALVNHMDNCPKNLTASTILQFKSDLQSERDIGKRTVLLAALAGFHLAVLVGCEEAKSKIGFEVEEGGLDL